MDTKKTEDMKFAKKKKKMSGKSRTFMLITIPIVALFFTFNTLPLIQGAIYSFTNFRGYGSYEWVGFRNYIDLFHDARVGSSYLFTFKLAIVTTIIVNVVSLILAMALNSKIRFKSGLRGLYFLPNILGGLVVGYIFNYFFTYILPQIAIMLGFEGNSMLASMCMAVDRDEYDHLYIRSSDSSGRCIRSRIFRWCNRICKIPLSDIPTDPSVFYN